MSTLIGKHSPTNNLIFVLTLDRIIYFVIALATESNDSLGS
jgi:hypothetical protein